MEIIMPILTIGGLGFIFGLGLSLAAKKFAVPVDKRVEAVRECLPGANCGGCGKAGCDALAKAIVSGESPINGCPICNKEQVEAIGKIMGQEAEAIQKVAVLRCNGDCHKAVTKFDYVGLQTCQDAHLVGGGPKGCSYGCLGLGSCKVSCPFNAIIMQDGLPFIDRTKCVGCGVCVKQCPRHLIHLVPTDSLYHVNCVSKDKGKDVKSVCQVGCIGCGLCVRQCEYHAIRLEENHAIIDPKNCVNCGKCMAKCPTKAITQLLESSASLEEKTYS